MAPNLSGIFGNLIETQEIDSDKFERRQVRIGEAPATAQIGPDPVRQNPGKGLLGLAAAHSARIGVQHPVPSGGLIGSSKSQGLSDTEAYFVIAESIRPGIENGAQCRAAQKTDKQEVVEMSGLKRGILAVVGETEQLALVIGNRALRPVQPSNGA